MFITIIRMTSIQYGLYSVVGRGPFSNEKIRLLSPGPVVKKLETESYGRQRIIECGNSSFQFDTRLQWTDTISRNVDYTCAHMVLLKRIVSLVRKNIFWF